MKKHTEDLELIANDFLENSANGAEKPNYSNRDFFNTIIIFQTALMDKLYDNQDFDKMNIEDRMAMAASCGNDLRKFIHTYTGLDTHDVEKFL